MQIKAETLDATKKTVGTVLMVGAAIAEIFVPPQYSTLCMVVASGGAWLLGFGMLGARGKTATQILVQAFGTEKPSEVQKQAIEVAARVASLAPPPPEGSAADNAITWPKTPPTPRSKP